MASWENQEKRNRLIGIGMTAASSLLTAYRETRKLRLRQLGAPSAQAKTHPLPNKPLMQMTLGELLFTPKIRRMKRDPFRKEKSRRRTGSPRRR